MGCTSSSDAKNTRKTVSLLDSLKLGPYQISNRVIMSPMTRCRGDPNTNVPNDLMAEYYAQRASCGLILTECSPISPLSNAFPGAGGVYTEEQVQGWKKVTDAVHAKGGKIVLQIWHCGRAAPTEFLGGETPIAPSAIAIRQDHNYTKKPHPVPKEMTEQDIKDVLQQFKVGAENALKAGFDGVQLHGANGYLVDQFIKDGTNKRTDAYGGSVQNRCKFLLEATDILIGVFGANKTSVRLTPTGRYNDMYDSNPKELLTYLLPELQKKNLQFVEIKRHAMTDAKEVKDGKDELDQILPENQISQAEYYGFCRNLYKGVLIANESFTPETAQDLISQGTVDAVAFGKLTLQNPDLVQRIRNKYPLNTDYDFGTFFAGGPKGYTDLPVYNPEEKKPEPEVQKELEQPQKPEVHKPEVEEAQQ